MSGGVRLDKWLWAARFFKTRALARDAIDGGKIHNILNVNDICSFTGIHSREVKKALKQAKVSFKKEPIKAAKIILTEMESKGW